MVNAKVTVKTYIYRWSLAINLRQDIRCITHRKKCKLLIEHNGQKYTTTRSLVSKRSKNAESIFSHKKKGEKVIIFNAESKWSRLAKPALFRCLKTAARSFPKPKNYAAADRRIALWKATPISGKAMLLLEAFSLVGCVSWWSFLGGGSFLKNRNGGDHFFGCFLHSQQLRARFDHKVITFSPFLSHSLFCIFFCSWSRRVERGSFFTL